MIPKSAETRKCGLQLRRDICYTLGQMQPFSLLIKAVGGACNLNCSYCFYKDHAAGAMSAQTLRRALDDYCALPFDGKSLTFQGGEPLMPQGAALLEVADDYPVAKSIQTNATLMTDATAARLAAGGWLVGASLDGPRRLNRHRGESFDMAVSGIRLLEKHGVDYNLLTVVSKANVAHPVEVYRFLRDNFSTRFHQYIECTAPRDVISGEEWGEFLVALFDEWIQADSHSVSIRLFDSIVCQLAYGHPTQCSFATSCRQHLVVEHDGSVYPCDFHVSPDMRLGNILSESFAEITAKPAYKSFAENKTRFLPKKCLKCQYIDFCNGDCPRNRQTLCAGWERFFAHSLPKFQSLANAVIQSI